MADKEKTERYQLRDQETSFFDDETGLEVTRDEVVEIGLGKGRKTLAAIKSGGLIKVDSSAAEGGEQPKGGGGAGQTSTRPKQGTLPEDFPGLKVLNENGVTTYAQARRLTPEQLAAMKGIDPKTLEEFQQALA